jgi:hypothetical protein
VDRVEAEEALSIIPHGRLIARANPEFRDPGSDPDGRTRHLPVHRSGQRNPEPANVHDAAHAINPDAYVAYIDNDPLMTSQDRALGRADGRLLALQDGLAGIFEWHTPAISDTTSWEALASTGQ